ncbi:hypothetical protein [Methylophaga sp. OBS4]|uniref:hypothetical protein n=1 Tax=Methylophaga sp. OBS4 TaxID=2991935 RepID=UPI00224FADBE|nr:hypothetical protein [Methylophaga sp. OBS4]MCX4188148.1 hypothetical protein [Methylophaga sp. OBS4]
MEWMQALEGAVALVTIIAAIYGAFQFIDWRIGKKIHEESFLRKISASLRPMVIFDENGSILLDQGGMEVIEKIEVSRPEGKNVPERITIFPKKHLSHAPILQTLENELINVETTRGKGYEWAYRLEYQMYENVFTGKRRFRLEVLL